MPNGKCRIHGGKSLKGTDSPHFKHGRYTRHLPDKIREKLIASDDDPLDLLPELDVQRALFADYLSRFQAGMTLTAGDVPDASTTIDSVPVVGSTLAPVMASGSMLSSSSDCSLKN